jgi:hypothetical protein
MSSIRGISTSVRTINYGGFEVLCFQSHSSQHIWCSTMTNVQMLDHTIYKTSLHYINIIKTYLLLQLSPFYFVSIIYSKNTLKIV